MDLSVAHRPQTTTAVRVPFARSSATATAPSTISNKMIQGQHGRFDAEGRTTRHKGLGLIVSALALFVSSRCSGGADAFAIHHQGNAPFRRAATALFDAKDSTKAAVSITGEELERLLTEWDKPLVIDAYATWCGPCLLMAPEFEEAAKELGDRVRFVKLDTDQEETMAARLNIMGLPTLLFLDKYEGEEGAPAAVLKGRIEGALQKQMIVDLCEHHFFGGPEPKMY